MNPAQAVRGGRRLAAAGGAPPSSVVINGWVTLEGDVDGYYQKDAVYRAVRDLTGVKGVTNEIRIKPHLTATQVQGRIETALRRSADIDSKRIHATVEGSRVPLRGEVRSGAEFEDAEWAAWSAPGVVNVENELVVEGAGRLLSRLGGRRSNAWGRQLSIPRRARKEQP